MYWNGKNFKINNVYGGYVFFFLASILAGIGFVWTIRVLHNINYIMRIYFNTAFSIPSTVTDLPSWSTTAVIVRLDLTVRNSVRMLYTLSSSSSLTLPSLLLLVPNFFLLLYPHPSIQLRLCLV